MENASKALLMAGGVLLTMLVLSLLMYGWTSFSEYQAELDRIEEIENVAKFNQQFTNYERANVQGYELLSLVNKVIDYNQRKAETGANSDSAAGNDASYEPIDISITMGNDLSDLRTSVKIYNKSDSRDKDKVNDLRGVIYKGEDDPLFDERYTYQIDTNVMKEDLEEVLNKIKNIERVKSDVGETINPQFGGATGIQNLVKNLSTIYGSPIIGYNGYPTDDEKTLWYDKNYIKSRYKTLTGVQLDVEDIRDEDNVKKVLQYYEYTYFKKANFKCTEVKYSENTGRVTLMSFEYIGLE